LQLQPRIYSLISYHYHLGAFHLLEDTADKSAATFAKSAFAD